MFKGFPDYENLFNTRFLFFVQTFLFFINLLNSKFPPCLYLYDIKTKSLLVEVKKTIAKYSFI